MGSNLRNKTQDNNNNSSSNNSGSSSRSSSNNCKLGNVEAIPVEETRQDTETSSTTAHSPNVTENIVPNDSANSNIDNNLIVKASADGKIEDIISPVAITEKKPFQKDVSGDKNKTPSSATSSSAEGVELERSNRDRLSSNNTSVQNLIMNKMSQTSLKRKQIPPPLGIQPSNNMQNKNQQQQQQQQNSKNQIQDKYRDINMNQNLKKPRVQYLGKVPSTRKSSKLSTIPYLRNRMSNYNSYSMYPSQKPQGVAFSPVTSAQPPSPQQQQQQCLFPNFPGSMEYPMSAFQLSQFPSFLPPPASSPFPAPFTAPFSTSTTPYMASIPSFNPYLYYYQNPCPNSRVPINPDVVDPTLPFNSVPPYLQYDENSHNNKHRHNNKNNNDNSGEIPQSAGSEYSVGLRTGRSPVEFETKLSKDSPPVDRTKDGSIQKKESNNNDDDDDDGDSNNIEESDLAIEEGAVPTPIFTRFQHDIASTDNRNNITNSHNVIFGEIKIHDNRYSFEYPQRSDRYLNKKIFMSICNQIWNECHK